MEIKRRGGEFPITPMIMEPYGLRVKPLVPLKESRGLGSTSLTPSRDTQRPLPLTPIVPIKSMDALGSPSSMSVQEKRGETGRSKELRDSSNLPECSREQTSRYEQDWEKILNPKMKKHLRGSKDILHGGRSLNMLLADDNPESKLYRRSKDWDLFSRTPKKIAQKIERKLDKSLGCNICDVVHVPIPQTSGRDYDDMSADLYRVTTPATTKDAEVDLMEKPKNLPTIRHKGIYHESLEKQYEKTKRGLMVPMRSFTAGLDKQRIAEYYRRKGKRI